MMKRAKGREKTAKPKRAVRTKEPVDLERADAEEKTENGERVE